MSQDVFFPRLETERLILKPLLPSDAPALLAIFSDAQVMRYWNTAPWADVQEAIAFIEKSNESMRGQQSLVLGIWLRSEESPQIYSSARACRCTSSRSNSSIFVSAE
ncbi:GNAT family N-acetyltransferase [Pseudomonas sp. AA-38]|uniref:GNAT family N-acetyltransferase n=1 Tax=Pseudomonas sp. AA-38 TaxID=3028807 RepID=UPI0023FA30B3|nr:GNAT family N-acetyltransferase [Pseudomonas sp. AA-38]